MIPCWGLYVAMIQMHVLCMVHGNSTSTQSPKNISLQHQEKILSSHFPKGTQTEPMIRETSSTPETQLKMNKTSWMDFFTPTPMTFETSTAGDAESILRSSKIIPDVIKAKPPCKLYVSYYHFRWNFGQVFDQTDIVEAPQYIWWVSEPETYHTLVMISPDFPDEKDRSLAQYLFWIVVNIPGIWVEGGETLVEYESFEPYSSGNHRLVLLLFKQPNKDKMTFSDESFYKTEDGVNRVEFSALKFATRYGLGNPLAINYCVLNMDLLPRHYP